MPKMKNHQLELLAEREQQLEAEEAQQAGAMWFYTRVLCQTCLPAKDFHDNEYERHSGQYHLIIQSPRRFGVPWGIYPRGIFTWMVTEIKKRKNVRPVSRTLTLGSSLSEFMQQVTGSRAMSGGDFGNVPRFKRQMFSLLTSRILWWKDTKEAMQWQSMEVSSGGNLFWNPQNADQPGLVQSTVEIGEAFWEDCMEHGHPVDIRVIRGLWPNCLAVDLYTWLTYRAYVCMKIHRSQLPISWFMLKAQFGPQYKTMRQFKWYFMQSLKDVLRLYPAVKVADKGGKGIELTFSRPSVVSVVLHPRTRRSMFSQPDLKLLPQPPTHKS
jgi:hypothetical protein